MPTISKIKDKTNDIIYDIEDAEAREDISDLKSAIRNSKVTLVFTGETYDLSTGGDGGDSSATIAAINAI